MAWFGAAGGDAIALSVGGNTRDPAWKARFRLVFGDRFLIAAFISASARVQRRI